MRTDDNSVFVLSGRSKEMCNISWFEIVTPQFPSLPYSVCAPCGLSGKGGKNGVDQTIGKVRGVLLYFVVKILSFNYILSMVLTFFSLLNMD